MPARKNKSGTRDSEGERLWDILQWSVEEQRNDIDRLKDMRRTLDASIDAKKWPTISKIPLATAWSTAEGALGQSMESLFPPTRFLSVMSSDGVEAEVRERVAWAMHIQMINRMRLPQVCPRSIRDSFSVSVGYGIVEPITITPPASFEVVVGNNRTVTMGDGESVRGLRYRYVSPGRVMPYPSGTDFNGPDATPVSFFLDPYSEYDFRRLYDKKPNDGEDVKFLGDVDEIVEQARSAEFSANSTLVNFADDLGGKHGRSHKSGKKNVPVTIPLLKCYEHGKHTWLFCGGSRGSDPQTILQNESYASRRNPMIKWDPWVDSDRWFPMSQPEADMYNVWAKNVWFNAIFDLVTWSLKPTLLYDSSELQSAPKPTPSGMMGIPGDVQRSARYLERPGVDSGAAQFGDIIDGNHRQITGEQDFNRFNSTRGGSMAFQDLVQSSTGRDRFRHAMLQMGGLESVATQVLTYMQVMGEEMDMRFQRPAYRDGEDTVEQYEITEEDIRHGYDIVMDFDRKRRIGSTDAQMVFAAYDRKSKSRYYDQHAVAQTLCFNEYDEQREVLPRDVVRKKQEENEAAQLEAMRTGAAGGGGAPEEVPALAGAMEGGSVR